MNYTIITGNGTLTVRVSGSIDRGAVISSRSFVQSLIEKGYLNFILDMENLGDEREMIYHVALINSFRNSVEQAGGRFTLLSASESLKCYLSLSGLGRLFPVTEKTERIA
mgnify:CR=1 FL=1